MENIILIISNKLNTREELTSILSNNYPMIIVDKWQTGLEILQNYSQHITLILIEGDLSDEPYINIKSRYSNIKIIKIIEHGQSKKLTLENNVSHEILVKPFKREDVLKSVQKRIN